MIPAHAHPCLLLLLAMFLTREYGVTSLELLELRVPAHVALGTRAALACRWALGPADVLYSVKWYKDGKEFFRHVPRDHEPRRKFPLPGVDVEKSSPNGANITLYPAVLETGGRYRCEVSGERPLFPTVSDHGDMVIVALPDHGPTITGSRLRYQIGDRVQVNCTSGRSRPATRLAWYINGEPAPSIALVPPTHEKHEDGLETTSLALDFKVKPKHFRKGDLKLKCLATIATVYWRSNEESVQGERLKGYSRSRELTESSRADRVQAAGKPGSAAATHAITLYLPLLCVIIHISHHKYHS
ncbi:uncharacterized protein LOC111348605 [Spodoptera litura]|uniref:Uncharacterized protein LOC111348605 n=1 Tax=Spodoptera litura TaxID=69820 RepID=A0A9J7II58_SPOLT|nr:uncharacterized protein LOC111348605 [Spodoptera litura]